MRQQTITTITTYAVLLLAGATPFTMPDQLGDGAASTLDATFGAGSLVSAATEQAISGPRSLRGDVADADSMMTAVDLSPVR
jgi:hypothetical protein